MAMIGRKPSNPNAYVPPVNPTDPPKPSFFGQGGAGRGIAGGIGDFLLQMAHMQPIYGPTTQRRQEEQSAFERGEQQYQRRRHDTLEDDARNYQQQIGLLDYKRQHPDDALTQALDQAGIVDPAERQKYYRADVERRTAPPMMSAPGVDEQGNPVMRFFPRAQPMPQTIPALPPGAVPIGGAGPQAPRPFRR